MERKFPKQLSGVQFVELVKSELDERNRGLTRLTPSALSTASGLSDRYLRGLFERKNPNPSVLAMRSVLFTLGFEIEGAEQDVVPHLKRKGVFNPAVHKSPVQGEGRVA